MNTEEYKGKTIKIEYDNDCLNPFSEWDWPSTLTIRQIGRNSIDPILEGNDAIDKDLFLKWVHSGDDAVLCGGSCQECIDSGDCDYQDELQEVHSFDESHHWLPIYKYEHSGVAYNTTGFSCPWDSGLTGFIAISKKEFAEEFAADLEPDVFLKQTVQLLSEWANGECYGYVVEDGEENHLDSCWGFYGDEGVKAAIQQAKDFIDSESREDKAA